MNRRPSPLGRLGFSLRAGAVWFSACTFYFAFSDHEKKMAQLREKLQKK
jgi:hypothetical protein